MLKKDITFIYLDAAQKSAYYPIAQEAEKRGYHVRMTNNKFERCEIGFYCEHVNHPQFSKASVIMLHDIIQQYEQWPDLWYREPWNKYDIGILPSDQWEKNWNACSQWAYARPRYGMFKVGWPKADVIAKLQAETYRDEFYKVHGLDMEKKTILYAPAWENDGKQDDFVQAMLKLDVNILIKQASWNPELYPEQVENIKKMYELHKDLERVTILPPETNIFEAIAVSDALVSEESSTMCEAAMMGVPAISVSDWLIPDTTPSHPANCNYDFVFFTTKDKLTDMIRDLISDYDKYHIMAEEFANKNFANIGKTSEIIMDIVDDFVEGKAVPLWALKAKANEHIPVKKNLRRVFLQFKLETYYNYSVRNPIVGALVNGTRKLKRKLIG